MDKFIGRIFLFVTIFITLSFLLQRFIDECIKHSHLLYYEEWNDILNSKASSDLLILGSSRARVQFSTQILDSTFHLKSCNLGMHGTGFNLQYCKFQVYMKYNCAPKYVIQNVDCTSTLCDNIFQFEQYIPYLDNEIIRNATIENHIFDIRDYLIPLYKYTHSLFTKQIIADGIEGFIKNTHGNGIFNTFKSTDAVWDSSFKKFKQNNFYGFKENIKTETLKNFQNFLTYCKNKKIKVILIYAPEYKELQNLLLNRDSIINIYRSLSTKYNAPFFDYSQDSICLDTINFYNSQHLNAIGVKKFNMNVIIDLKQLIN